MKSLSGITCNIRRDNGSRKPTKQPSHGYDDNSMSHKSVVATNGENLPPQPRLFAINPCLSSHLLNMKTGKLLHLTNSPEISRLRLRRDNPAGGGTLT
jgi:hypothetical protein